MKVKTYEIFTELYSKIIQAYSIFAAIREFKYDCSDDIIAVIEQERGQEFLKNKE